MFMENRSDLIPRPRVYSARIVAAREGYTARNTRDRQSETKTSFDQSNDKKDIEITASIRRAVMHEDNLSMTAKNVKIITENGVVTLRGPVQTAAEKATIAKLAQSAAGQAKIVDQLEVKKSE